MYLILVKGIFDYILYVDGALGTLSRLNLKRMQKSTVQCWLQKISENAGNLPLLATTKTMQLNHSIYVTNRMV